MDKLINKIIEIDKIAQKTINKVENKKEHIDEIIDTEIAKQENEIDVRLYV